MGDTMPPMDGGMDSDPMGGPQLPDVGGDGMGDDPMGGEIPSGDGGMDDTPDGGEGMTTDGGNQEIDDIFGQLSTEDQASVLKYAKSMVKDNGGNDGGMPDMQAESKQNIRNIVTEVINNILGNEDNGGERPDNKIRNKRAGSNSPFVTKY